VKITRDTNGVIVDVSGVGPLMLSWLSLEYNFTYVIKTIIFIMHAMRSTTHCHKLKSIHKNAVGRFFNGKRILLWA
jgi:hypothetical protein